MSFIPEFSIRGVFLKKEKLQSISSSENAYKLIYVNKFYVHRGGGDECYLAIFCAGHLFFFLMENIEFLILVSAIEWPNAVFSILNQ